MNPVIAHVEYSDTALGGMVIITACTACPARLVMDREPRVFVDPENNLSIAGVSVWRP